MNLDLRYYLAVLLRRLHYILIIFLVVTAISVVVAYRLPPVYESSARLLLENSQIPDALAAPTVDTAALEQLQIVQQRLLTRQNLLEIAHKFAALPKMDTMDPDDVVTAMLDATRIDTQAGRDQATLMTVAFDAPSGQVAAAVVNEYITRILADSTSSRTTQAQDTLQFFRQEVDRLSADLTTQSAKILAFQNQNADALPDTQSYRLTQQSNLQERLAGLDRQIADLKNQRQRLIDIYRASGQTDLPDQGANLSPEAQQLAQLKIDLTQALAVYAPTNPKVALIKTKIAELEAKVNLGRATSDGKATPDETGTDATGSADPAPRRSTSPLDIHLADQDAQIIQLSEQRDDVSLQLATLKDAIERSAGVAVQLQALQRDYDNIQGQYNTATDRLSKASTGERIEVLSKGQRIAVLDPATVPDKPVRPRRKRIAAMGAAAGLMLGLGLVGLVELLNTSVRRPIDLERHLDIKPIGTIPYTRTPGETLRRRLGIALFLVALTAGLSGGAYLVDRYYMPMDIIMAKMTSKLGL